MFGKTKVVVSSGITKVDLLKCIVYPCGVCILRVSASSILCVQCGMSIRGGYVRVKRVTAKFS